MGRRPGHLGGRPGPGPVRPPLRSRGFWSLLCNTPGVYLAFWHLHFMSISIICSYMIVWNILWCCDKWMLDDLTKWSLWVLMLLLSCVSSPSLPRWSLKKFQEVWIQKVKWKDKLHACWNDLIKWKKPWVTNLTLQSWSNYSRWTLQQKSWSVHIELVPRKCFIWSKALVWALSSCYFDQSESLTFVPVMRFDLKQKL